MLLAEVTAMHLLAFFVCFIAGCLFTHFNQVSAGEDDLFNAEKVEKTHKAEVEKLKDAIAKLQIIQNDTIEDWPSIGDAYDDLLDIVGEYEELLDITIDHLDESLQDGLDEKEDFDLLSDLEEKLRERQTYLQELLLYHPDDSELDDEDEEDFEDEDKEYEEDEDEDEYEEDEIDSDNFEFGESAESKGLIPVNDKTVNPPQTTEE